MQGATLPQAMTVTQGMNTNTVILVASHIRDSGSHLAQEICNLARALTSLGTETHILIGRESWPILLKEIEWYPELRRLPITRHTNRTGLPRAELVHLLNQPHMNPSFIFLDWLHSWELDDVSWLDRYLFTRSLGWATIANASSLLRSSKPLASEVAAWNMLKSSRALLKAYYWDPLPPTRMPSELSHIAKSMPEYHLGSSMDLTMSPEGGERITIGFFGSLTGQRGLGDFIWLALLNPHLSFRAQGRAWPVRTTLFLGSLQGRQKLPRIGKLLFRVTEIVMSHILSFLARVLPNIRIEAQQFADQRELNSAIATCTAVFVAANHQYWSSGIALQSLACHIPVIWTAGNSAASDHLRVSFPEGQLRKGCFLIPGKLEDHIRSIPKEARPSARYSFEGLVECMHELLLNIQ